jgi:hypothetical protein
MIITTQIQKIVFNVASTCVAESFRVKNKACRSLRKVLIWHQNAPLDRHFV